MATARFAYLLLLTGIRMRLFRLFHCYLATVRGVGEQLLPYLSTQAVCKGDSTEGAPFERTYAPTSCTVYIKGSLERIASTQRYIAAAIAP
jgi:hypothetical protein